MLNFYHFSFITSKYLCDQGERGSAGLDGRPGLDGKPGVSGPPGQRVGGSYHFYLNKNSATYLLPLLFSGFFVTGGYWENRWSWKRCKFLLFLSHSISFIGKCWWSCGKLVPIGKFSCAYVISMSCREHCRGVIIQSWLMFKENFPCCNIYYYIMSEHFRYTLANVSVLLNCLHFKLLHCYHHFNRNLIIPHCAYSHGFTITQWHIHAHN